MRQPKPGLIIPKNCSCVRVKNVDSLIKDLQKTIEALETLSEMPATAGEQIDELLDPLFQQKIDLVSISLNVSSQPFIQASQAMKQAANKAARAVKDPTQVEEMYKAVSDAISKLAKLLDSVTHIN
jgi:methyl-accepting chemotaxis protein